MDSVVHVDVSFIVLLPTMYDTIRLRFWKSLEKLYSNTLDPLNSVYDALGFKKLIGV